MAEETQILQCNGDTQPEASQISNIIDQMDTSLVCERSGDDAKEVSATHLADNVNTLKLQNNKEAIEEDNSKEINTSEDHPDERESLHQQDSEMLSSQTADPGESEEHGNEGDPQARIEAKDASDLSEDFPSQQDLPEKEQETESQDLCPAEEREHPDDTREEETLTETEEENTSIETDNDNGQGSCDEQENGSRPHQANPDQPGTGNRPDISRHSYSRYDTVSYRKIRRGNTKQRIDEFESMMN